MSANERQVGGDHYKRKVQHWDLMAMASAGYFAGQITKYAERHSRKNGREDLEKSLHFAEKMHEVNATVRVPQFKRQGILRRRVPVYQAPPTENPRVLISVRDYAVEAGLTALQERIFELCLLRPDRTEDIVALCRKHLDREYGAVAEHPAPEPIPTYVFGDGKVASVHRLRINDQEGVVMMEPVSGTPEDGGQHESEPAVELEPALSDQIEADFSNEALARAIAAIPPEPDPKPKGGRTPPEVEVPEKS